MKKAATTLIALLLLATLTACGEAGEAATQHTPSIGGVVYTVDTEAGTVTDGEYTYRYEFSGDAENYTMDVTYPDDSTWHGEVYDGGGSSGWSDDYGPGEYLSGERILSLVLSTLPEPKEGPSGGRIFLAIVLFCVGAVGVFAPHAAWYVEWGWRYRNAEPSTAALAVHRIAGVILIAIGVIILLA